MASRGSRPSRLLEVALAVFVLLVALSSSTLAFQCYVCNSKNHTGCDSPPSDEYIKTCETVDYANHQQGKAFSVCRLQVIASDSEGVIFDRRCGWIKHNENRETCLLTTDPLLKATNCECHTDRCNGAPGLTTTTSNVITLSGSLLFATLVWLRCCYGY